MADKKISLVPLKAVPTGAELVPVADGGLPKHLTAQSIADLAAGGGGITDWDANPTITLPDATSVVGGVYTQGTQTLDVNGPINGGSPATNVGYGTAVPGSIEGAVALMDVTDVLDSDFGIQAILEPFFNSSTGGGTDVAFSICGIVPATATAQDIIEILGALLVSEPAMPGTCPWLISCGYAEGTVLGGDVISVLFKDATNNINFPAPSGVPVTTDNKIVANFGFGTTTPTQGSLKALGCGGTSLDENLVSPNDQVEQVIGGLIDNAGLETTNAQMFICVASANFGSGHNAADQKVVMEFNDDTYLPLTLLPGSLADLFQGVTQADLDGIFSPNELTVTYTPPALDPAELLRVETTTNYFAYGADLRDGGIFENNAGVLQELSNIELTDLVNAFDVRIQANSQAVLANSPTHLDITDSEADGVQGDRPFVQKFVNVVTYVNGPASWATITLPAGSDVRSGELYHIRNSLSSENLRVWVAGDSDVFYYASGGSTTDGYQQVTANHFLMLMPISDGTDVDWYVIKNSDLEGV